MYSLYSLSSIAIAALCLLQGYTSGSAYLAEPYPCTRDESLMTPERFQADLLSHGTATACIVEKFAFTDFQIKATESAARPADGELAICVPTALSGIWSDTGLKGLTGRSYRTQHQMLDGEITRTAIVDKTGHVKVVKCHAGETTAIFKEVSSESCFTQTGLDNLKRAAEFHKKLERTGVHFCMSTVKSFWYDKDAASFTLHQRALDVVATGPSKLAVCYDKDGVLSRDDSWFIDNLLLKLPEGISYNKEFIKPGQNVTASDMRTYQCKLAGPGFLRFELMA